MDGFEFKINHKLPLYEVIFDPFRTNQVRLVQSRQREPIIN